MLQMVILEVVPESDIALVRLERKASALYCIVLAQLLKVNVLFMTSENTISVIIYSLL